MAPVRSPATLRPWPFGRGRVLAHHADRQAERRAVQQPADRRHEQQRQQRECGLFVEHRDREPLHGCKGLDRGRAVDLGEAHAVGVARQAGGEQRDAQARDVLRQRERHRQQRMQRAEGRTHQRRHGHAGPQAAALVDREPSGKRARDHDAFDAEVEHAGALAQQHAQRAQDQRRGDAQHRHPERRGQQQVEGFAEHGVRLRLPLTSSAGGTARTAPTPAPR